jgi:hypothetical protein
LLKKVGARASCRAACLRLCHAVVMRCAAGPRLACGSRVPSCKPLRRPAAGRRVTYSAPPPPLRPEQAAAGAKVAVKDAVKGGSTMVAKVAEADVKGTARRLANKVAERAEGGNFALVEEIPEVEAAMVNLKQTDTAYRELLAVLREAFVAQGRAVARQLRVANRAEVIGRDIESEAVSHGP